jgi:hypothetical protein
MTSGKSTYASFLRAHFPTRAVSLSFASEIKKIATNQFNWDGVKDDRGRKLLQRLGHECGRTYDENVWVRKEATKIINILNGKDGVELITFDDLRYPNEVTFLSENIFLNLVLEDTETGEKEGVVLPIGSFMHVLSVEIKRTFPLHDEQAVHTEHPSEKQKLKTHMVVYNDRAFEINTDAIFEILLDISLKKIKNRQRLVSLLS